MVQAMSKAIHDEDAPLVGLKVVELGGGVAVPYCAKLLADLGADVIKIETAAGDPARSWGPRIDGALDPERSGSFLYLNTSKRSVVLDLEIESDREQFEQLVGRSDILLEDHAPGALTALASTCRNSRGSSLG